MMHKYLFIDRDGTLIVEPPVDFQVDRLDKLALEPSVIPALLQLQHAGFKLVMITNQDGLGTPLFPQQHFEPPHHLLMQILQSQGVQFEEVLICPHFATDECACRKPKLGLVKHYLDHQLIDRSQSYVIGDRQTDLQLAENMGIMGILYHPLQQNWPMITQHLLQQDRYAKVIRNTKETQIRVEAWLDRLNESHFDTGIGFFNHMLDQIATHAGIRLVIEVQGDLDIDDHHTVEDTALALGKALHQALGDKKGIGRFGFVLPMDECLAQCTLDLSGRPYLVYQAAFNHQKVGDLSSEMVEHFFRSLSYSLCCTLHLTTNGHNDHHRAESLFKAFGRTLRQAIKIEGDQLPSSKGVL